MNSNFNALLSSNIEDFPYRKHYMPLFSTMFNRLTKLAIDPPKEWFLDSHKCKWGVVIRTYPDDYESVDSMSDHFVEPARIQCNERNYISPAQAWVNYKNSIAFDPSKMLYESREEVYKRARGCNLFNPTLGTYVLNRLISELKTINKTDFQEVSVLDCTSGWGDRLISAFAIPTVKTYLGWDTNPDLQESYARIADACEKSGAHKLNWCIKCAPFEQTDYFKRGNVGFEQFDIVFTSPPFYNQEIYKGEKTSTNLYKNLNEWNMEFYKTMLERAQNALKPNGYIALYITPNMLSFTDQILCKLKYRGCLGFQQLSSMPTSPKKDNITKKQPIRPTFIWQKI